MASNEDFAMGMTFDDDGSFESSTGEQHPNWPADGYNLYRDDVTDTGNIDEVYGIWTTTPEEIDLPNVGGQMGPYTVMWGESDDTWYWATEPRGYNLPSTKADILEESGVPGKGLDKAPGLQKPFNPDSKAGEHAGKK